MTAEWRCPHMYAGSILLGVAAGSHLTPSWLALQGHASAVAQAQVLLVQSIACGLVALPHAASCLLGPGASFWASALFGAACCPLSSTSGAVHPGRLGCHGKLLLTET